MHGVTGCVKTNPQLLCVVELIVLLHQILTVIPGHTEILSCHENFRCGMKMSERQVVQVLLTNCRGASTADMSQDS